MNYIETLFSEIHKNLQNNHKDNWDYERYGEYKIKHNTFKNRIIEKLQIKLNQKHYLNFNILFKNKELISQFEFLFNLLNDDKSKLILINVLLYRIFGHKKIKLQNNEVYFKEISNLEKIKDNNKFIQTEFENFKLYFFDLNNLQIPIYMYFTAIGIYIDFVIKQYSYFNDIEISASKNDIVIDGGGCWGDTSLYFANEVGNHGKVYSFEFVPKNLNIFRKNLSLNQHLCNVIEVIEKPIWNISDKKLYYIDNGPASKISFIKNEDFKGETETISIDDFVIRNKLEKLNFIKLDIEGAELNALLGGVNAIKKFKPNLAIALYHNPIDFYNIPKFINDLNLGYKFYLKHLTIHKEETILFASTN